ncbi:MAG: endonuclease III domain-containing protein [Candidatus Edwardsbacteria bacterium]
MDKLLLRIYRLLLETYGPQHWWPGDGPFEVIVGAILTQNTAWPNVVKAIENLKAKQMLEPDKIYHLPLSTLAPLIRSSGFYKLKARRLKSFVKFFMERYEGKIDNLKKEKGEKLRKELLAIKGIGPETADSILLYALQKPFFVIDAYTRRIFSRHHFFLPASSYQEMQNFFMHYLPKDVQLFNEYHALIVKLAKVRCYKKNPNCSGCPLEGITPKNKKSQSRAPVYQRTKTQNIRESGYREKSLSRCGCLK